MQRHRFPRALSPSDLARTCILACLALGQACGQSEAAQDGSVEMEAQDAATADAEVPDSQQPDAASPQDDAGADGELSHCKRGLGYGYHSKADLTALRPGVHWWYNWPPARCGRGQRLSRAGRGVRTDGLGRRLPRRRPAEGHPRRARSTLLGFNEPNFFAQANLTPPRTPRHAGPSSRRSRTQRGLKLVSPAVNFCGPAADCHDTDPFKYLDAFFAACKGCRVDYVAAHWYACDGPALEWYLGQLKKYKLPIWLTEFSCLDGEDKSVAAQKKYMQDALAILEGDARRGPLRVVHRSQRLGAVDQPARRRW